MGEIIEKLPPTNDKDLREESKTSSDAPRNEEIHSGSPRLASSLLHMILSHSTDGPIGLLEDDITNSSLRSRPIARASTTEPTLAPQRRASFGLGFLSTISNSMRTSHHQNGTSSNPASTHTSPVASSSFTAANVLPGDMLFMANSPTMQDLSSYTVRTRAQDDSSNVTGTRNARSNLGVISLAVLDNSVDELQNEVTVQSHDARSLAEEITSAPPRQSPPEPPVEINSVASRPHGMDRDGKYLMRLTTMIDHSSAASGLYFSPIIRKIAPGAFITVGRYTEKNKAAAHAPLGSSEPVVFKSKVVSRTHALFCCDKNGQWFLKDCKSLSGTFLNHIRLSAASQESELVPVVDGSIIQLGMDYRGGTEEAYRCVKMRCEFNKSWQRRVNQFNLEIHNRIKNLHVSGDSTHEKGADKDAASPAPNDVTECAICLMQVEPAQALFISPCSHTWHYKCIRPIIVKSYPQFYCPNCRTMCDLETDLDDDDDDD